MRTGRRTGGVRAGSTVGAPRRRAGEGLAVLLAVVAGGSLWYWLAEGFTGLEAVYQTITTVTTVGFREVHPLDASGQVATMVIVVIGVGAALYTLTQLFEELVETQADRFGRRRMERRIGRTSGHVVVCGYGRIGAKVAELLRHDGDVVVIDHDEDRVVSAFEAGLLALHGDPATDDAVLEEAGVERARALVTALPDDADNVYVVLSARTLSADLHIVSRAESAHSDGKLLRAGADRVVNPEDMGARRLAAYARRPDVSELLDAVLGGEPVDYRLEELKIRPRSPLDGVTIQEARIRERTGALLLGLRSPDGAFAPNPPPEARLTAGMTLIAAGAGSQLDELIPSCLPSTDAKAGRGDAG
jgi:voltage-gated potassium channel